MSSVLKGIPVTLHVKRQMGTDEFNRPVYVECDNVVENVLVTPKSSQDKPEDTNLGKKFESYELCIPKGDCHTWENAEVTIRGKRYKVTTFTEEYIESMVPLDWNKKVTVERHE